MSVAASTIADNLQAVRERMAGACARVGREPSQVRLVTVTKTVGLDEVRALVSLGVGDIGENRPLELVRRADALPELNVDWHLVGHLQRNKVRKLLPRAAWIHAVDSVRLVTALGQEARRQLANLGPDQAGGESEPRLLLEINLSGERQKTGMMPDELEAVLAACREQDLATCGLMTMARYGAPAAAARAVFSTLRELRDRALERGWAEDLPELSMGMTDDFELAIESGATVVRIGRALFN